MTDGPAAPLRAIVELLDRAAIPYMVDDSFASMVHGVPRTTQDLAFSIEELRRRTLAQISDAQISDVQVSTATAEDTIISKLE